MNLLHLDTSIVGQVSVTRKLTAMIVERLAGTANPPVVYRDLAADALGHLTLAALPTVHPRAKLAGPLDVAGQALRDESDRVLQEFLNADTIVLGVPMYNFTVPSQLKAWVDRIVVPGTTFRYGPNGPEGLATGKRVVLALARGGFYGPESATLSAEHAESWLRSVLGFIGIQPEFVVAEGLSAGEVGLEKAMASARAAIEQLSD